MKKKICIKLSKCDVFQRSLRRFQQSKWQIADFHHNLMYRKTCEHSQKVHCQYHHLFLHKCSLNSMACLVKMGVDGLLCVPDMKATLSVIHLNSLHLSIMQCYLSACPPVCVCACVCAVHHRPAILCHSTCQTKEYSQHTLLQHGWGVHIWEVSLCDKQLDHINTTQSVPEIMLPQNPLLHTGQGRVTKMNLWDFAGGLIQIC